MSLIIIDVGSDSIKYAQPKISINEISEFIMNKKEHYSNLDDNQNDLNIVVLNHENDIFYNDTITPKDNESNDVSIKERKEVTNKKNQSENYRNNLINQLNPNNIFDNDCFMKTVPTILFNNNMEKLLLNKNFDVNNSIMNIIKKTNNSNFLDLENDFFSNKCEFNLSSLKLDNEFIYSGVINDFEKWENVLDFVGNDYNKDKYSKDYFNSNPVLLTQKSLDFYTLQSQTQNQYEILFEKKMCPIALIASQALMILLSFNQLTGIVVDIGESGTTISVIVEGITQYNNSIHLPFMSGRMLNIFSILNSREENNKLKGEINLKIVQDEILDNKYTDLFANKQINKFNLCPVFSYTECFKLILNPSYTIKNRTQLQTLNGCTVKENITFLNGLIRSCEENFGSETFFDNLSNKDFNNIIMNYRDNNGIEASVLSHNSKLMKNLNNLINGNFKQLNLAHYIYTTVSKAININPNYESQLINVYFSGGILNNLELQSLIKSDINLVSKNDSNLKLHFPSSNAHISYYKGFNFMSKLNNYQNIFLSQKDYYEYGSEHLSFNYI